MTMRMLELQRQFTLRTNQICRFVLITVALVAFGSALIIQIQSAGTLTAAGGDSELSAKAHEVGDKKDTGKEEPEEALRYQPTDEEMKLLARAVYSEARGEQFNGQVAVAAVILNRIGDPRFPNDVADVIFEPQAFTAVADGQFWLEPDATSYHAVEEALKGEDPSQGAVFYYNPVTATSWWIFTRPTITQIGRHVFAS